MRLSIRSAMVSLVLLVAGCGDPPAPPEYIPRVEIQTVRIEQHSVDATLTGDVQARVQAPLSFRVGGRIGERLVDVGDEVKAGQVLARLDRQDQLNNLRAAQASAQAERARLKQADADLWRQQQLLPKGYTSRSEYDAALAAQRGAKNSLAAAEAQLSDAREQLSYTDLKADAAGVITARQAEVGQVVQSLSSPGTVHGTRSSTSTNPCSRYRRGRQSRSRCWTTPLSPRAVKCARLRHPSRSRPVPFRSRSV